MRSIVTDQGVMKTPESLLLRLLVASSLHPPSKYNPVTKRSVTPVLVTCPPPPPPAAVL